MTDKPVLWDFFSGAGGAARGYQQAGFYVIGVDINPQPNYAGDHFIQGDAIEYLQNLTDLRHPMPDAIHASPPCQFSSALTKGTNRNNGKTYVNLIPKTRELLAKIPVPSVIENVQGAQVRKDLVLCGEMFGLDVIRHRYFECNFPVVQPPHIAHRGRTRGWRHGEYFDGPYLAVYGEGGGKGTVAEWQKAMGIDWTDVRKEIAEAIPPLFAKCVGTQMMKHIKEAK